MEFQQDEMQWLLKNKMDAWRVACQAAKTQQNVPVASVATKAPKKKPEEKKSTYVADTTPLGEKKDTSVPINPEYHPKAVEAAWMAWWEKKGFFHADLAKIDPSKKIFTMVIPPPNVTGALHLGHALMLAIEDAVVRWKRMSGYETLWLPG